MVFSFRWLPDLLNRALLSPFNTREVFVVVGVLRTTGSHIHPLSIPTRHKNDSANPLTPPKLALLKDCLSQSLLYLCSKTHCGDAVKRAVSQRGGVLCDGVLSLEYGVVRAVSIQYEHTVGEGKP